jgi:hypothetical protein
MPQQHSLPLMARITQKITRAAHREVARLIRETVISAEYDLTPKGVSQDDWERIVAEMVRIASNHEYIGREP